MTPDDFLNQQKFLIDWMNKAVDDKEQAAAWQALQNLNELWVQSGQPTPAGNRTVVRRTRKKMTPVQKFDKKNSRREAIMAQRERRTL